MPTGGTSVIVKLSLVAAPSVAGHVGLGGDDVAVRRGQRGGEAPDHRDRDLGVLGDGLAVAVLEGDLPGLGADVAHRVEDREVAGRTDEVGGVDLLAVELVAGRDLDRQVAVVVADAAQVLRPVDLGGDDLLAVLGREAAEPVEVADAVGDRRVVDGRQAVTGQGELLVEPLRVDLAGGVGVRLHRLGVDDLDAVGVLRGGRAGGRQDARRGDDGADRQQGQAASGGGALRAGAHRAFSRIHRLVGGHGDVVEDDVARSSARWVGRVLAVVRRSTGEVATTARKPSASVRSRVVAVVSDVDAISGGAAT